MHNDALEQLRAICLALPEAVESGGVGNPSFKVRDKIFAMRHDQHRGQWSIWCKAGSGIQEMLVQSEPERYFVPPYVGHHGWVGIQIHDDMDWEVAADLITKSYRMTAPKRLSQQLQRIGE